MLARKQERNEALYVLSADDIIYAVRGTRDGIRSDKRFIKPAVPHVKAYKVQVLKEVR